LDVTLPVAFEAAGDPSPELERRVRLLCRDKFHEEKLLNRVVPDIQLALAADKQPTEIDRAIEEDPTRPTELWTPSFELPMAEIGDAV
jgi:hypothetical protein